MSGRRTTTALRWGARTCRAADDASVRKSPAHRRDPRAVPMGSARQRAEYKLCARPLVARSALAKVSDQMRELAARARALPCSAAPMLCPLERKRTTIIGTSNGRHLPTESAQLARSLTQSLDHFKPARSGSMESPIKGPSVARCHSKRSAPLIQCCARYECRWIYVVCALCVGGGCFARPKWQRAQAST